MLTSQEEKIVTKTYHEWFVGSGHRKNSVRWTLKDMKRLIELYKQNTTFQEISEQLDKPLPSVWNLMDTFCRRGIVIPRQKKHLWDKPDWLFVLLSQRDGWTLAETGSVLSISRQRVYTIVRQIEKQLDFSIHKQIVSRKMVAERIGVHEKIVSDSVKKCLPYLTDHQLLTQEEARVAEAFIRSSRQNICPICKKTFIMKSSNRQICYDQACVQERSRRRGVDRSKHQRHPKTREICRRIKILEPTHSSLPANLLPVREAVWVTGLSESWLRYLIKTHVLSCYYQKNMIWRGKPVQLLDWREIEIVCDVYKTDS